MAWVDVAKRHAELMARQQAYADQIVAWLSQHFPDLCGDHGPHPAAIAAVVKLHAIHGKGSLTVAEHGPTIRVQVVRFDADLESVAA